MKKILIIAAALALSTSAFAQFTIIGGLTTTSGKVSEAIKTENFSQFHAGVGYRLDLPLGFALLPSLQYNVRGTYIGGDRLIDAIDLKFKHSYIELPVQVQWGFSILPAVLKVFAVGEPYVSYALNIQAKTGGGNTWESIKDWGDIKRFHYGVGLGGGVELFKHLQVSARYIWDFAGSEFNISTVPQQIKNNKASGVKVSAAIIF